MIQLKIFQLIRNLHRLVLKNPTKVGTSIVYTDTTYSSLQAFKFSSVTTTPQVGEEISQVLNSFTKCW